MTIRRTSIAFLVLGVIFLISAALIRWVMLPTLVKLPADLSQSQKFEGTVTALNPQAFAANDLANLISPPLPITADRGLTVDAVDGDTAIVTSNSTLHLPQGAEAKDVHSYAVSRVDYTSVALSAEQVQTLVPQKDAATFEPHEGVAFSLPMDPPKNGVKLYDSVTQTGQPATFVDSGKLDGRDIYNYAVKAQGPVKSPAALAQFKAFPAQLPKAIVAGLLQAGVVPAQSVDAVRAALPTLPDTLNIGFASTNNVKLAVDRQFGAPLNVQQQQIMYVTAQVNGMDVPVLPLSTVDLHTAPNEITALTQDLSKNGTILSLLGFWLPIALLILGVVLLTVALRRWRKPAAANADGNPVVQSPGHTD